MSTYRLFKVFFHAWQDEYGNEREKLVFIYEFKDKQQAYDSIFMKNRELEANGMLNSQCYEIHEWDTELKKYI